MKENKVKIFQNSVGWLDCKLSSLLAIEPRINKKEDWNKLRGWKIFQIINKLGGQLFGTYSESILTIFLRIRKTYRTHSIFLNKSTSHVDEKNLG